MRARTTDGHPLAPDADSQAPRALHLLSTRAHTRRWVKKALGEKGVGRNGKWLVHGMRV
eukprot:COSAG01_NODE_892_length_12895_cov_10.276446_1_plen_59_part_00